MRINILIVFALTHMTSPVAAPLQLLSDIQATAAGKLRTHFMERKIDANITVGHLDERLTLPACAGNLESFFPPGANEMNISLVGVRCNSGSAWTVYVPVEVQFNYSVLTATRGLAKGTVFSASDISVSQQTGRMAPTEAATSAEQIIGKELVRSLAPGAMIPLNAVRAPLAIKRGDAVRVRAGNKELQILVSGIALSNGAVGDVIQVKNTRTERVLVGTVRGPGDVEVDL